MSATVICLKAASHKVFPQTIRLDLEDLERIQLEIRAARSALVVAMQSALADRFKAETIGEAFFSVLQTMENACNQIDKAKGIAP